ncbi:MAG: hypothetical protein K6U04_08735 [Armatimonadetes bacterium]|nr:hypothetical protein [Armatimonadota bacterium]
MNTQSATKIPPVGTLIDEGRMSSLGRSIASGELCIILNPRVLTMSRKELMRWKSVYECLIDELEWDIEIARSETEQENLKNSRGTAIMVLNIINKRLEKWDNLGKKNKITFIDRRKRKYGRL